MTEKLVPFSSRPSQTVKNVIWYLCLKLVFIFNTLNLKLEVVKFFQVDRDRNPKEKRSSKSLNFTLPPGIIWFSLSSPFTVLPPISASVLKFSACFFVKLYYSPKLLSLASVQSGPEGVRIKVTFFTGSKPSGLHRISTCWSLCSIPAHLPLTYWKVSVQ